MLTSLDRARDMPVQDRYVMVDTAGARLYMIDDGRIVDSMKVIVGKADPSTQTPMLASTIYYATLNPYWHVRPELMRSLIASNVLEQGLGYLKSHGYQVMPADGSSTCSIPSKVDWQAVADGRETVRVRQLPGPANSMGQIKFGFPNDSDIYLHDTPNKDLFAQDDRGLSHGCIRLEDAERLGRWLMGRDPQAASARPEHHVAAADAGADLRHLSDGAGERRSAELCRRRLWPRRAARHSRRGACARAVGRVSGILRKRPPSLSAGGSRPARMFTWIAG